MGRFITIRFAFLSVCLSFFRTFFRVVAVVVVENSFTIWFSPSIGVNIGRVGVYVRSNKMAAMPLTRINGRIKRAINSNQFVRIYFNES